MPRYKAHHPDKRQCRSIKVQPSITNGPYALYVDDTRPFFYKPDPLPPGDRGDRICCGSHIITEDQQLHIGDILQISDRVVKISAIVAWSELPDEVIIELADNTETSVEIALLAKMCYEMVLNGATE